MKRSLTFLVLASLSIPLVAGFKPKNVRPKKPEQYQVRISKAGVTFAADLLLEAKDQKDFFYRELTTSDVIALRLAIFNQSAGEVLLPIDSLQLVAPDGKAVPMAAPETVAKAVLGGMVVPAKTERDDAPVAVRPNVRTGVGDPRTDRTDPTYDPRLDPTDPTYDPRDPRNRQPGNRPTYGPWSRPGVDVILNPAGGGSSGADLSRYEKGMVEKDFSDKAHLAGPLVAGMVRDRFLYFSMKERPQSSRGFVLRIPGSQGIPEEIELKF